MLSLFRVSSLAALLLYGSVSRQQPAPPPTEKTQATQQAQPQTDASAEKPPIQLTERIREGKSIRLGGVYTLGLGTGTDPFEPSYLKGTQLSDAKCDWIADYCDVIVLSANTITPDTFPTLVKRQKAITPLLYVNLNRPTQEREQPENPSEKRDPWFFFRPEQTTGWRDRMVQQMQRYRAYGIVTDGIPTNSRPQSPKEEVARVDLTGKWLATVHAPGVFYLVPSARNFDALAGRPTLATAPGTEQPHLTGRLWDEYSQNIDGVWAEGWPRAYPYTPQTQTEKAWDIAIEAAERAVATDQIFIAAAPYRNDAELEYALASYLMVAKRQSRMVFQPLPQKLGQRTDSGMSLAVLQQEVARRPDFFNVALGYPMQQRHPVQASGGMVWRRGFEKGVVYVNSSDRVGVKISLGGRMRRLDGRVMQTIPLPPHSGLILLYPPAPR